MDEFPSNAHGESPYTKREVKPSEDPKVVQVTVNQVVKRKKSLGRRFVESFATGDDSRTVIQYVMLDVIVPATKDAIADAVSQFVERSLFGEPRSASRRTGQRPNTSYTNYTKYSSPSRSEPREISKTARARHDFEEVIISTRAEAEQVLSSMLEVIEKYNSITVADFYDLVGITGNHADNKWGWEDLRGTGIVRVGGGYLLDLPKPDPLR